MLVIVFDAVSMTSMLPLPYPLENPGGGASSVERDRDRARNPGIVWATVLVAVEITETVPETGGDVDGGTVRGDRDPLEAVGVRGDRDGRGELAGRGADDVNDRFLRDEVVVIGNVDVAAVGATAMAKLRKSPVLMTERTVRVAVSATVTELEPPLM